MKIVFDMSEGKAMHVAFALQDAAKPYRNKANAAEHDGYVDLAENYNKAAKALEEVAQSIIEQAM